MEQGNRPASAGSPLSFVYYIHLCPRVKAALHFHCPGIYLLPCGMVRIIVGRLQSPVYLRLRLRSPRPPCRSVPRHQHLSSTKHLLLLFTKFLYTYKNHYGSRYKKFCKKYLFPTPLPTPFSCRNSFLVSSNISSLLLSGISIILFFSAQFFSVTTRPANPVTGLM